MSDKEKAKEYVEKQINKIAKNLATGRVQPMNRESEKEKMAILQYIRRIIEKHG